MRLGSNNMLVPWKRTWRERLQEVIIVLMSVQCLAVRPCSSAYRHTSLPDKARGVRPRSMPRQQQQRKRSIASTWRPATPGTWEHSV